MTDRGLKPGDLEMIAAFLDRQLSETERREFMERLDRDEALYEVFVETVRYRETGSDAAAPVIEHPAARGRTASWVLPTGIAALLALAVAVPLLLRDGGDPSAGFARALVADGRLDGSLPPRWTDQGWRVMRSGGGRGTATGSELESAFRVGVHTVDLEIALRLGRLEDASRLLAAIERELGGIDLSDQLRVAYGELREQLEAGLPPEKTLELALDYGRLASEFLERDRGYALGRWAEAGKWAARSGNREVLGSRAFRKLLRELRARSWNDDLIDQQLGAIAAALDDRAAELDLEALDEAFTALIDAN